MFNPVLASASLKTKHSYICFYLFPQVIYESILLHLCQHLIVSNSTTLKNAESVKREASAPTAGG